MPTCPPAPSGCGYRYQARCPALLQSQGEAKSPTEPATSSILLSSLVCRNHQLSACLMLPKVAAGFCCRKSQSCHKLGALMASVIPKSYACAWRHETHCAVRLASRWLCQATMLASMSTSCRCSAFSSLLWPLRFFWRWAQVLARQSELECASGQAFISSAASCRCFVSCGDSLVVASLFCSHIAQSSTVSVEFVPCFLEFDRTLWWRKEPARCTFFLAHGFAYCPFDRPLSLV
jgi:hypothetical protein